MLPSRHPNMPRLEQIIIPDSVQCRLYTIAHYQKIVGQPGVTQMHATLQRTSNWLNLAADVTSASHDCVYCATNRDRLRKLVKPSKTIP